MKLSQLLVAWDSLRERHDVGEVGFCDLATALTNAGVDITDNCVPYASESEESSCGSMEKQLALKKKA